MFWPHKTKIFAKRFTFLQQFCFIINEAVCPPFTWYEVHNLRGMNEILFFLNRTFKCLRGISKYHHFRLVSGPDVIFVRVSPTTEEEKISSIKPNVDLNYPLTSTPNIFHSCGLSEERKLYSVIQTCTAVLQ